MCPDQAATVAAETSSRFVRINGLRLHYLDWGGNAAARTFVLLHGGSAHVHWWDSIAPRLTPHGRVLALDFRGHGKSQWARPAQYGPSAHLADLRGFLEQLGTPIVLVGHSMGGELSQRAAIQFPHLLRALVIVDAPHGRPPLAMRLLWRWRRRSQGGPRRQFSSPGEIARRFRLSPPGTCLSAEELERLALLGAEQLVNGNWAFRFDPKTRSWRRTRQELRRPPIGKIKLPTLIIRGASSKLVSRGRARAMHRRIRGSILREIPRAFHHVLLDNPAETADAIIEFVEGIRTERGR
jgi:pimeloyl-ACP methyl ester carboxylesterase